MTSLSSYCIATLLCLFLQCALLALPEIQQDAAALSYREKIVALDPMNIEGLDPSLARILSNYYEASFGGELKWQEIESFRFEGVLRMSQGALRFVAYKKKPDYCKITLYVGNGATVVMSYDGADAWQHTTAGAAESAGPIFMPPVEALNFIRDAPVAGHLLYPSLPGKQIELTGGRSVDGYRCYDLRVTLPDGQQVTYAIDSTDFVERQQTVVNAVTGATEVTTHEGIDQVAGVSMPMQSTMAADGAFVHEVQMRRVEANIGLMSWMFARPSGNYYDSSQSLESASERARSQAPSANPSLNAQLIAPAIGSFGLEESPASVFGASRFSDLDAATAQFILNDLDEVASAP